MTNSPIRKLAGRLADRICGITDALEMVKPNHADEVRKTDKYQITVSDCIVVLHDAVMYGSSLAYENGAKALEKQASVGSLHVGNALRGAANLIRALKKDLAPLPVEQTYPDEDDILGHSKELHDHLGHMLDAILGNRASSEPHRQQVFEAARVVWTQSHHLRKTVPEKVTSRKTVRELEEFAKQRIDVAVKNPGYHSVVTREDLLDMLVFTGVIDP